VAIGFTLRRLEGHIVWGMSVAVLDLAARGWRHIGMVAHNRVPEANLAVARRLLDDEEQPLLCLVTARSVAADTGWLRDPGFVDFIGRDRLLDCMAAQLNALPRC
jgi:hypothetical protein